MRRMPSEMLVRTTAQVARMPQRIGGIERLLLKARLGGFCTGLLSCITACQRPSRRAYAVLARVLRSGAASAGAI